MKNKNSKNSHQSHRHKEKKTKKNFSKNPPFSKPSQAKTSPKKEWNFIGVSPFFMLFSFFLTLVSCLLIFSFGFNYGIDFAGGTEVQVQFNKSIKIEQLRQFMDHLKAQGLLKQNAMVQSFGEENEFLIRIESLKGKSSQDINKKTQDMIQIISKELKTKFEAQKPVLRRVDSVGPQVGSELKRKGFMAIFYSLLIVLAYISLRFDYKYAPGAVLCLFHDTMMTLGIFTLFKLEVNIQTLAAILTIIGYSLNDTIVTFDRIRENVGVQRDLPFPRLVNRSINEVLSRSLLTSFTTLLALGAMYLISGGVIQYFAFTLGIGVMIGTYSSIFVASPLVILADKWQNRSRKSSLQERKGN